MADNQAIVIEGVTKRFGATVALDNVTLAVPAGSVHAILGENGAGKSTLIKVLSGMTRPDNGVIRIFGQQVSLATPSDAMVVGIRTAFQELSQIPHLTVAQNLLMPNEPTRFGLIQKGRCLALTQDILERYELEDVDPGAMLGELDLSVRQKLEITYAISRKPKILLLDEPTSALTSQDVDWLRRRVAQCTRDGVTIVFITHRMPEVRELCTSLSIIRNGVCVGSYRTSDIDDAEVFRLIMGRTLGSAYPPRPAPVPSSQAPVLNVRGLRAGNRLHEISLSVRPGECLGIAALQGMGQLELFKALFGLAPATAGTIEVNGQAVTIRSPGDAIAADVGMSLVPEERKTEGLVLNLTGKANVSLPTIARYASWGKIDKKKEAQAVAQALHRVSGNPRALYEAASAFSGGNQQKFVIAKWLLADSKVLLLFDPTRGVDVGAKFEIYQVMRDYLSAGGAVLLHSTEIPELANMCDRILVLYAGKIVAELDARHASEAQITTAMLGVETRSLEHADGDV